MSKQNILLIALLVIATGAGTVGYLRYAGLASQLEMSTAARAAAEASLEQQKELLVADSIFHARDYGGAVEAYRSLTAVDSSVVDNRVEHAYRIAAMLAALDTLRGIENREPLAPVAALPAAPPTTVRTVGVEANDPEKFDSLSFALKKSEMQVRNLRQRLQRSSGPNYLTFTSKKGNDVYYVGEIREGKAHGDGVALLSTGSRYFGEWKSNLKHGVGEFYWEDGAWYEGDYENDQRSGQGTYHFPKGDVFIGEWKNDVRNGPGVFYDKKGKIVAEGTWKNDELVARKK